MHQSNADYASQIWITKILKKQS